MKKFEYTARDETGATRKDTISAIDRAGAIDELRKRNLVMLSLVDAKGLSAKNGSGIKVNIKPKFVFFALLGISVVFLTVYLITKPKGVQKKRVQETPKIGSQNTVRSNPEKTLGSGNKLRPVDANQTNIVSRASKKSRSPADIAKDFEASRKTNSVPIFRSPPAFTMAIESLMSAVSSTRPGNAPTPLPPMTRSIEATFQSSLTNNIIIYETDSPELAKQKEDTAYVKQEFAKFVAEGYTPKQIFEAIHEERKDQHKFRKELNKELMDLYKEGRMEEAKTYLSEANVFLNERGITPLHLPKERDQRPVQ